MADTPNLAFPEITAGQAQKEVTHNDALRILDALVQTGVVRMDAASAPASASNGDVYVVTSAWASAFSTAIIDGFGQKYNNVWYYMSAHPGYSIIDRKNNRRMKYMNSSWTIEGKAGKFVQVVSASTTVTLDYASSHVYEIEMLAASTPLEFVNVPVSGEYGEMTVYLVQGSGGTKVPEFVNVSVRWDNASAPGYSTTAGKEDVFTFEFRQGISKVNGYKKASNVDY
jgi:hypothetical protein